MTRVYIPEKLKKALLQFNLTDKEITAYVGLLEKGASSVQELARATGMNRVTTYAAMNELLDQGLVAATKKGKRRLFVAESPDSLRDILENKQAELKKTGQLLDGVILPALKAIDIRVENRPQIKFFEGLAGIYKVYDDYILKAPAVIGCGSYDAVMKVSSWDVETAYIETMRKHKLIFRGILEDTPINRKFDQISRGVMHNKFLPVGTNTSADILVFGQVVTLISYERQAATVIEDQSIADSIRLYLEFIWERL